LDAELAKIDETIEFKNEEIAKFEEVLTTDTEAYEACTEKKCEFVNKLDELKDEGATNSGKFETAQNGIETTCVFDHMVLNNPNSKQMLL